MRFSIAKVKPGRIYILRNPLHQVALVKIGYTQGASEDRSSDLSKPTGVPYPFEVMYEEDVADCELAERLIHQALSNYRPNPRREFFQLPLKLAVRTVFETCLRVNSELIREKSRLSIWLNQGGVQTASELRELLSPRRGGDTCVYLTYRNEKAEMQLRLSDSYLIHCSAPLLIELKQKPWVEDVFLNVPIPEI